MEEYRHLFKLFETHLEGYIKALGDKKPAELYQPEAYILSLGGKRLRPLLALISCELLGGDPKKALDAALSIELFHNFSLIHDDILDKAPLRRGKATVHEKWNTDIAILSGDVMLVKALQCLESYPAGLFRDLSRLLTRTSIEVCEGQQMDMNFENMSSVPVEDYVEMIGLKTAVLLGCSLQMGALVAGAENNQQQCVYSFGKHLGLAFQLRDDLLDAYAQPADQFGKQLGGDILSNKKTFLLLKALETANTGQKKELEALLHTREPAKKINDTLAVFNSLNVRHHCEQAIDRHTSLAIECLKELGADKNKVSTLNDFAMQLMQRQR